MQRPGLDTLACVNPECQRFRLTGQDNLTVRKVYGQDHIRLLRCWTCGGSGKIAFVFPIREQVGNREENAMGTMARFMLLRSLSEFTLRRSTYHETNTCDLPVLRDDEHGGGVFC